MGGFNRADGVRLPENYKGMKIAIFTPSFLPKFSGAEIFHHNLATRLAGRGHEVAVVLPRKTGKALQEKGWALPYRLEAFPANVWSYYKRWPALASFLAGRRLGCLQRRHGFDVWHGVMAYPTGVSLVPWAQKNGVAHLIRSAGDDVISSRGGEVGLRLDGRVNRLVAGATRGAQAVVALSDTIREEFVKLGVAPERIHTIPNAVDLARFQQVSRDFSRSAERENLGMDPGGFLFLAVGRNHPQKNYPVLLEAARILQSQGKVFQVLLLGRGTEEVARSAEASGLTGIFRGTEIAATAGGLPVFPPETLVRAYCAADCFVMPSVLEGFSTALLEAMAAELPVITTDAPGCGDFVRNGKDAIMVPVNDAEALSRAMLQVLENGAARNQWRELSKNRAAMFGWDSVLSLYENLYFSLAEERRIANS